jgi:hypothetical protein
MMLLFTLDVLLANGMGKMVKNLVCESCFFCSISMPYMFNHQTISQTKLVDSVVAGHQQSHATQAECLLCDQSVRFKFPQSMVSVCMAHFVIIAAPRQLQSSESKECKIFVLLKIRC